MNAIPNKLIVRRAPGANPAKGLLIFGAHIWPCVLGKNGITSRKLEGDMKSPIGRFKLLFGYYRKDRLGMTRSRLPLLFTKPDMGWCDEASNPNYNRPVKLPFKQSHEKIQRQDNLYDLVIVMDHNYNRRTRNRGSAVFFHLTADKPYTAGCVAVPLKVMRFLIPLLSKETVLVIEA